jgi:hypothetical protein
MHLQTNRSGYGGLGEVCRKPAVNPPLAALFANCGLESSALRDAPNEMISPRPSALERISSDQTAGLRRVTAGYGGFSCAANTLVSNEKRLTTADSAVSRRSTPHVCARWGARAYGVTTDS